MLWFQQLLRFGFVIKKLTGTFVCVFFKLYNHNFALNVAVRHRGQCYCCIYWNSICIFEIWVV